MRVLRFRRNAIAAFFIELAAQLRSGAFNLRSFSDGDVAFDVCDVALCASAKRSHPPERHADCQRGDTPKHGDHHETDDARRARDRQRSRKASTTRSTSLSTL